MKKQQAPSVRDCIRRDIRRVTVFCMLSVLLIFVGVGWVDGNTGFLITGEARTTMPQVTEHAVEGSFFGVEYSIPLPDETGQAVLANALYSVIPPGIRLGAAGVSLSDHAAPAVSGWLIDAAQFVMSFYQDVGP